jgi:2-succinyl-5-enolpyruvyl-6-hydroxy-3-cyclohexene-1-carboxylate synthase
VTADRPHEWIDQQDNQTLRQKGIYSNYIKGNFELPQAITTKDELWHAHRIINDAVNLCTSPSNDPVHLNVPLTEPLYDTLPAVSEKLKIIHYEKPEITLSFSDEMISEWHEARKIMIIHGQDFPGSATSHLLSSLSNDSRIITLAENIANTPGEKIIANFNLVLSLNKNNSPEYPDLILHSGGQVVSKALTGYLRRTDNGKCWRIGTDKGIIDTFKKVTRVIPYASDTFYHALSRIDKAEVESSNRDSWMTAAIKANSAANEFILNAPFSDLQVFNHVFQSIPAGTLVVLGNSSIIRYSQLFPANKTLDYYSNRGVSGIDGCLSTAAGIAFSSNKPTLAILGDLSFIYDSNALWNRELSPNLRILVINNEGGEIFHILKGPSDQPAFTKFVEAYHPVNIRKLADAFGLDYFFADEENLLINQWDKFIDNSPKPALFEVKTDPKLSAQIFRKLMTLSL